MTVLVVGAGDLTARLLIFFSDNVDFKVHHATLSDSQLVAPAGADGVGMAALAALASSVAQLQPSPQVILDTSGRDDVAATLRTVFTADSVVTGLPLQLFADLATTTVRLRQEVATEVCDHQEVTQLREVQTLLDAIIQSTQDAISVVDRDGRGILVNPAYTRMTGMSSADVVGKPAEVDIAEGESVHRHVLRTGEPMRNVPMKVGPRRREVLVNVAPLLVSGELRGSVGVIQDVSEIKRLTEELDQANKLIRTLHAKYTFADIVGTSPAMVLAIDSARRAAQTPATVLLRGESGTGKELFAHAIHHESKRHQNRLVRVSCAALSESLLESELFGYEEGAFTGAKRGGKRGLFEEASGGTLFLDEIGELTPATQAKLLRALQEREIVRVGGTRPVAVDVRVIAATHIHLEQAMADGRFREDLYYRLNVVPILIPPLRYRREDIPAIAAQIVVRHNQSYGRNVKRITPAASALLCAGDWPGNVRELENAIGRAMIHMDYREADLEARHLPPLLPHGSRERRNKMDEWFENTNSMTLRHILDHSERLAIARAVEQAGGNKTEAARQLGISVRSLYYKLGRSD